MGSPLLQLLAYDRTPTVLMCKLTAVFNQRVLSLKRVN
jgi:hypothetical protein